MRAMGIDPSLTATGIVVLESGKGGVIVAKERIVRTKKLGDGVADEVNRLVSIVDAVDEELAVLGPDGTAVCLEGLAFHRVGKTVSLTQLGALNYMIRKAVLDRGITLYVVPPSRVKKFVADKGNCQKDLMFLETYKRYGLSFTDENLCDAHGLARVALAAIGGPDKLTARQKEVIDSL